MKRIMKKFKEQSRIKTVQGFTLLELMVVMMILGLLAAVVAPNVLQNQESAMIQKAKTDIAALEQALEMYKADNFRYPTTDQGLEALVVKPESGPEPKNYKSRGYIKRLPSDPWGNDYQYLYPGEQGEIDIYSNGANGEPGGEESDADIGNWDLG